jgi:hypothetical protein
LSRARPADWQVRLRLAVLEKDPARAAAQREQAKQLAERLKAMQSGSTTQLHNDQ